MDGQRPGIGNSAAFQVSGWPWITGSIITSSLAYVKVELPTVAKSVTVFNKDVNSLWPFTQTGSCPLLVFVGRDLTGTYPPNQITRNHFVEIPVSGSYTFETKCTQVFIAKKSASHFGAFQLSAAMTNCSINDLYAMDGTTSVRDGVLTGSGIDQ